MEKVLTYVDHLNYKMMLLHSKVEKAKKEIQKNIP